MFIWFFLFSFIKTTFGASPSYVKSIFGHPGTDEVENEYVDGIEIIETGLPHPKTKMLPQGKYTTEKIDPNDYGWPDHPMNNTCTLAITKEESKNINGNYTRTDLTQEEMEYHPVAAKQWYTTDEEIANADRVKIKFSMQPNYHRHFVPGFVPPGEVVTIEIPEAFVNQITICFNYQTRDFGSATHCKTRLDSLRFEVTLNRAINKVGLPYGGSITFYYSGPDPLEVIISGLIPQPYFYYGMTSDEEWENDLRNRPGPCCYFDTGNIAMMLPSKFIRQSTRLNDCMKFYRSAIQISQTTARDVPGYNNPRYARILNPVIMKYETFVSAGEAVAMVGGNFVHAPCYWVEQIVNYDQATDNPWGTLHEINHHHQTGWGKTQDAGEMSNNAVNLVIYAKTNLCSGKRLTSGWPRYSYAEHMLTTDDSYGLQRYSTMLHLFGVKKFKEFVIADQDDKWYPREKYGVSGGEMLRASRVFNRNMRYHWNFHLTTDEQLTELAINEVEKMNLKPFHPVATKYGVGYIIDGVGFRTARPFRINPFKQTIDFASTIVQRAKTEWFGNFEFKSATFEKGRESAWVEKSKGVYELTPKEDMMETEEVNVTYLDTTTNDVQVVICQFTQKYSNTIAKATRYGYIPPENNNLMKSYKYVANNSSTPILEESYRNDGIFFGDYENGNVGLWLAIEEGMFSPSEDGSYQFAVTADTQSALYLSEEPLKNDPDLDADKLICFQQSTQMNYNNGNHSKIIELSSDKNYYFRYIVFPITYGSKKGRGWAGYKKDNVGNWANIPVSWLKFKNIDKKILWDNQFVPDFERMYLMDQWTGTKLIANDAKNWELYSKPRGRVYYKSNDFQGTETTKATPIEVLTDGDPYSEFRVDWWSGQGVVPFPHVFEIDMKETNKFKSIRIGGPGNPNLFGMNNYIKIYLAPYNYSAVNVSYSKDNYSINHEESLIWEGVHNPIKNDIIEFDNELFGRYLKIISVNNSLKWKDNWDGRTSISSIEVGYSVHANKVYPTTNTKYFEYINKWDERRGGCYFNGKGHTGHKGSILNIAIPHNKTEIGIIGDYYPEIGTATVKLDNEVIGSIGQSLDKTNDIRKLTKASRSYKSLLFFYEKIDPSKNHKLTIEITQGDITFSGIITQQMIVDYFNDNGTYEKIYEDEFNIYVDSEEIKSESNVFEFTQTGFLSNQSSNIKFETILDQSSSDSQTINFDKKEIYITESGMLDSKNHIYFKPSQEGSTIKLSNELKLSKIGVVTDNSPTVKFVKSENPLVVMNNQTTGSIKLDANENQLTELNLERAINYKGVFNLIVSSTIKTVRFTSADLSDDSSLSISRENKNLNVLASENESPSIHITDHISITPNSKPTLSNTVIEKYLNINDDSSLTMDSNSKFTEISILRITIKETTNIDEKKKPIVYGKNSLNSIPSEIILTLPQTDNIEIHNLSLIGSESFDSCSQLPTKVKIENGRQISYSTSCKKQGQIMSLCLNIPAEIIKPDDGVDDSNPGQFTPEKNPTQQNPPDDKPNDDGGDQNNDGKKKKSNVGLIVGVIIGVVAVIAIIVFVVIFVKRKKSFNESSDINLDV